MHSLLRSLVPFSLRTFSPKAGQTSNVSWLSADAIRASVLHQIRAAQFRCQDVDGILGAVRFSEVFSQSITDYAARVVELQTAFMNAISSTVDKIHPSFTTWLHYLGLGMCCSAFLTADCS